jgi:hypothetical protein
MIPSSGERKEVPTLLGPLERAYLTVSETLCFLVT